MSIYKKLSKSDKSIIPFNANRLFNLTHPTISGSSQWSVVSSDEATSPTTQTFFYSSASLHTFSSASTDVSNSLNYHQLDHLFYKNYKTDISNKFGDVNFINNERELYDQVNVISIPSGLFGLKIKEGTFNFSGSNGSNYIFPQSASNQLKIDNYNKSLVELTDYKGNLIISGTNLNDHSVDIREKVFFMGPIKGFKQYDLNSKFYREIDNPIELHQYYSKKDVMDDSFYLNNLHYKDINFSKEIVSPELCLNRNFNDLTLSGSNKIKGWNKGAYSGSLEHQDSASLYPGQIHLTAGTATAMAQISTTNSPLIHGKSYEAIYDIAAFTSSNSTYGSSWNINLGNPYPRITNRSEGYDREIGAQHSSTSQGQFLQGKYKTNFIKRRNVGDMGHSCKDLHSYIWDGHNGEDTSILLNSISCREEVYFPVANFEGNTGKDLILNRDLRGNTDGFLGLTSMDTFEETGRGMHIISLANGNWGLIHQNIGIEEGKHYEYCITVIKGPTSTTSVLFQQDTNTLIKNMNPSFPGKPTTYKGKFIGTPTSGVGTHNGRILFKTGNANSILDFYIMNCSIKEIHPDTKEPTNFSSIMAPHNETYNFNTDDDFTISMYVHPKLPDYGSEDVYLVSKSTTKTDINFPSKTHSTKLEGSSQLTSEFSGHQYPFEIYIDTDKNLTFRRSDGNIVSSISSPIDNDMLSHIVCMRSGSQMEIWVEGKKVASGSDTTIKRTNNQANLYIGNKGEKSNFFSGSMSNLMIFNQSRTSTQIENLRQTINGSPYVGNIFYSQGIVTITHPLYHNVAKATYINRPRRGHQNLPNNNPAYNVSPASTLHYDLSFKNIHPIFENEYQCTVESPELNFTNNTSIRKYGSEQHPVLSSFATGSLWKPYVSTIGLYDENHELLVVGKLGQAIRMSDETDTTFVLRWDT